MSGVTRNLIGGLLLAALLGLLGWFVATRFEASWAPVTSSSEAASKNPMLGAERLLARRGYHVKTEETLSTALFQPLPQGTLILSEGGDAMLATQSQALLAWVERGNTLVVSADWPRRSIKFGKSKPGKSKDTEDEAAKESQDSIAAHFNVSLGASAGRNELCRRIGGSDDEENTPGASPDDARQAKDVKKKKQEFTYVDCVATLTLPGVNHPLRLDASEAKLVTGKGEDCGCSSKKKDGNSKTDMKDDGDDDDDAPASAPPSAPEPADPPDGANDSGQDDAASAAPAVPEGPTPQIADDEAKAVRIYAHGKGRVVILSEDYFNNYQLPSYDHGELLLGLAALNTSGKGVMLIQHVDVASWVDILWHASPYAICSLAVFLLLWAWTSMRRFGPQLPDPDDRRRAMLEHIDASGRWLWKSTRGREIMLAAMRRATERTLARRIPELRKMPQERQIERIAADGKMSRADLERALQDAPGRLPIEFTRQIQILQELRAHYER